ncbi:hypothetical protein FJT64_003925 [Amphibalanus amphitrite]|uniref:Chitin-binding type-2 domain-containing protein n=1 Tax=Amphibalanus amphitrite TaxID=1232801 RepID=A0A6A4W0I8_AMPAM|nr:hypothetical protein FJT64_003925 [Amphibalanus amphitrite]
MAAQKLVLLVMTSLLTLVTSQQPPPNYSYDALPETSFSCEGRVVGGYYADVEAGCQMFHVGPAFRFLCPNNTVFDQQHLICANWFQVSCDRSTVLYARNFEIFKKGSENEVEFNALDEEDLPELEDYDSGFQETSSGAGRFFGGGGGSRRVTAAPRATLPTSPFGRGGSFSFGTGVSSRAPVAPTAGPPTTAATARPELSELTNDLREQKQLTSEDSRRQFDGNERRKGVSVSSTPRSFSSRTLPPTTPAPIRVVSVSPASPFVREGAIVSRRRGSRWRGGSRVRPSAESVTGVSSAAAVAPSVSPSAAAPSAAVGVSGPSRRPAVARPVPRPTASPPTAPPAELTNEIDSAPTRKPTPRSRSRGRGSRRFDPRLPGGDLSPTQYVRTRGGRGRLAPPTVPPPTLPPQLSSISDIADVEALTDQLNLLDEQELLEELEREDRRFRNGPEANNRSIDSSSRRQKLPDRGTTPAPLLIARGPPPTRPASRRPTAPPTAAAAVTTPQIIRKRIRVRGRPSRRPRVGGRRRTTTTRRPTTTTTTTEAPTTPAPPPRTRPAVTFPPTVPPAPTTTPAPTTEVSTLPTNKEASNVGRQSGGFFLRPKLQLSSALPTDLQTRRLNDVNELAAERTGRSRNTSPIAFSRGTRSTTRAPEARLSEILFASSSPGRAGGGRTGDADYDYQYYDSDFRLEHQDDIEDVDDLFQTLSRKSRWT